MRNVDECSGDFVREMRRIKLYRGQLNGVLDCRIKKKINFKNRQSEIRKDYVSKREHSEYSIHVIE